MCAHLSFTSIYGDPRAGIGGRQHDVAAEGGIATRLAKHQLPYPVQMALEVHSLFEHRVPWNVRDAPRITRPGSPPA